MKKTTSIALICIGIFLALLFIPTDHFKTEKGLLFFNSPKTMIFFIHDDDLSIDMCDPQIKNIKDLKGFAFRSDLSNYNLFFLPKCHVLTAVPGKDFGIDLRSWFFGKCEIKYSYNASLFQDLIMKLSYKFFLLITEDKKTLSFKFIDRRNIVVYHIKELK